MNGPADPRPDARPVRVLIVDDDPLVRLALRNLLDGAEGIAVTGAVGDGAYAVSDAQDVDVVLMDIRMPDVDGLTAARALLARPRPPAVIMLTTFDTDEHVAAALDAGAAGFLLKDTAPAEIVAAIHRVAAGDAMLSPSVTRRVLDRLRGSSSRSSTRRDRAAALLAQLTDREREVAAAVGRGRTNAQIAAELHMSVPTVKTHITRGLTKLGVANRVQLALLVHDADNA